MSGWWHPAECTNQHDEGGNCLDADGAIVGWREGGNVYDDPGGWGERFDDEAKARGLLAILRGNARYTDAETRNVRTIVGFMEGLRLVRSPEVRMDFVAMAQHLIREHWATHGEAEMCGAECIVLGLTDDDDTPVSNSAERPGRLVECPDCRRVVSVPETCKRPVCVHAWDRNVPEIWDDAADPLSESADPSWRVEGEQWRFMVTIALPPRDELRAARRVVAAIERVVSDQALNTPLNREALISVVRRAALAPSDIPETEATP